ncbi:low molecular weight protein-tyrosine-phosphatase [Thalassorhabdus alkalitolerans]|uniref:protein-tyrosine-phosphatase n=1 Tax=Thalassorhabdus alkalitolerans TaxID=2282697 RepID=A0ABW0YRN8_9BACI|nr:low molecular weight protein-tyrosine-phosphatase [Thalassobacillus sp. C254]
MINVLFVCLGNICRSPMAEAVFKKKVQEAGLSSKITVDSAGTGHWHIGNPPHEGTISILTKNNIEAAGLQARQLKKKDLSEFEYIIAMDAENLGNIRALAGHSNTGEISRLLDYDPASPGEDVPDPYFTGNFEEVYEMVDCSCTNLLTHIREREGI